MEIALKNRSTFLFLHHKIGIITGTWYDTKYQYHMGKSIVSKTLVHFPYQLQLQNIIEIWN